MNQMNSNVNMDTPNRFTIKSNLYSKKLKFVVRRVKKELLPIIQLYLELSKVLWKYKKAMMQKEFYTYANIQSK